MNGTPHPATYTAGGRFALGIDVGGTKVAVSVADRAGLRGRVVEPTVREGAADALGRQVLRMAADSCARAGVAAVKTRPAASNAAADEPRGRRTPRRSPASATMAAMRRSESRRSTPEEMSHGRNCCSAVTGPFQPKRTARQFHSGTPGPVWMRALAS